MLANETIAKISAVLDNYPVAQARVFGSRARNDAREDSDIDLHIEFTESAKSYFSLFELVDMKRDLEFATGKEVDLVTKPLHRLSERFKNRIHDDIRLIYEKRR